MDFGFKNLTPERYSAFTWLLVGLFLLPYGLFFFFIFLVLKFEIFWGLGDLFFQFNYLEESLFIYYGIILLAVLFYIFQGIWLIFHYSHHWFKISAHILLNIFIIVIALFSIFFPIYSPGPGRDSRRIADLRETQNILELFYMKNKEYPDVSGPDSWERFKNIIIKAEIGVSSLNFPREPLAGSPPYEYGISLDRQHYVLKTKLERLNSPILLNDLDGFIFGVDCDDSSYCVSF